MAALLLATVLVPSETGLRVWLSDQLFQWVNAEISPVLLQTVTNAIDTLGDLEIAQQGGMFGSYNFTVGPITASEPGIGAVTLDLVPSVGLRAGLRGPRPHPLEDNAPSRPPCGPLRVRAASTLPGAQHSLSVFLCRWPL